MRTLRDTGSESAFTLIEMMIALVLTGVVLAVALPSISNMLGFANRGAATAQSSGESQYLAQLIERDLRSMAAPRAFGLETPDSGFASGPSNVKQALNSTAARNHDLLFAGPRAIMFWANVAPTPGPEVVRWYLVSNSPMCDKLTATRNWCVVRDVISGSTASLPTTGTRVREIITGGTGSVPVSGDCAPGIPAGARLFCYRFDAPVGASGGIAPYTWTGWRPTCTSFWGSPATPAASNWNDPPASAPQMAGTGQRGIRFESPRVGVQRSRTGATEWIASLDRITAVGVVAPGGGRVQGDSAQVQLASGVDLRNRSTPEYRTAILCGAR